MERPTLKVAHISDTHCAPFLEDISRLGEVDILIHSGDATFGGRYQEFVPFFNELKNIASFVKHVIYVPGNHDRSVENNPSKVGKWYAQVDMPDNVHVLVERYVDIEGYRIYGHPYTPAFFNWAFNYERGGSFAQGVYRRVPTNTDVLVTHGPPKGILDRVRRGNENVGCEVFANSLANLPNLKLSCFGHIHEQYGVCRVNNTLFSNASFVDDRYNFYQTNPPLLYELSDSRAYEIIDD